MDDEMADEMADEIDLEELLAELDALDEGDDDKDDMYEIKRRDAKKKEDEKKKDKEEMKEAIATINTLRSELNEVNLLNAKLLYVNKIFKARNLNESQKLKVIAQFDKATTAREAKTIFESMSTAIAATSSVKKGALKESIGFASKAAGVAPKKNIVEVDETMSRWQMLAGIKKF
jgi:predicted RNase H-like nuclease (RuvC/YqgF family)